MDVLVAEVCATTSGYEKGALVTAPVEIKDNIKRQWWRTMVTGREDVVGLDSSVILPRPP